MSKKGTITYRQQDKSGHFAFNFKITNYQAAKILEYLGKTGIEPTPFRDSKGRFAKLFKPNSEETTK